MTIGAEMRGKSHNIKNSNAANISKGKNASSVRYEKKRRYHGRAAAIAAASAAAFLAASALALASAVRGGGRRVMLAMRSYNISIAFLQPCRVTMSSVPSFGLLRCPIRLGRSRERKQPKNTHGQSPLGAIVDSSQDRKLRCDAPIGEEIWYNHVGVACRAELFYCSTI